MKRTISSILVQANVRIQIVIADDDSQKFPEDEIIPFFHKKAFSNYTLCEARDNHGTVSNIINGIGESSGLYFKLISPGDYIYGNFTLYNWINVLKQNHSELSSSDCVYYKNVGDDLQPCVVKINPQVVDNYYHNSWYYNYLIFNDIVLGADVLSTLALAKRYLTLIEHKVFYAEDNIYRLMASDELSMCYFHNDSILYEYGTGISTSGSSEWARKLEKDWDTTDQIILSRMDSSDKLAQEFQKVVTYRQRKGLFFKIISNILIKGKFNNAMRMRMHPRFSHKNIDRQYVKEIFDAVE